MGVSTERTARLASTHHARFVSRGRELLFSCHTLSPSKSDHQLGYPKLNALPSPGGRRVFLLAISTLAGGGGEDESWKREGIERRYEQHHGGR